MSTISCPPLLEGAQATSNRAPPWEDRGSFFETRKRASFRVAKGLPDGSLRTPNWCLE